VLGPSQSPLELLLIVQNEISKSEVNLEMKNRDHRNEWLSAFEKQKPLSCAKPDKKSLVVSPTDIQIQIDEKEM
jgi:hypothetical protein